MLQDARKRLHLSATTGRTQTHTRLHLALVLLSRILATLSCSIVLIGLLLNNKLLYNHEECSMTWSQREFIQLSLPTTASAPATNSSYRLYKFTDQRDPRQQQLHINPKDFCTKSHDNTSIVAVMYVPGHGGSYEQSRSLGAHGVQMTGEYQSATEMRRAQHYLQTGHRHGEYEDADNFVFDVYAVHFAQEPTGLHGRFLHHQADYLARAIAHIAKTCALTQIYVVAHSLGGYVARLARIAHPSTRPLMRNLITLATPHDHVVLSYEATIRQSHDAMMRQENADDDDDNLVIISIAGGLRDGLIPPMACVVDNTNKARLSLLATDLMTGEDVHLGMDHQAIVWCHNLLRPAVRTILHALVQARDKSAMERVQWVQSRLDPAMTTNFADRVKHQRETLVRLFGKSSIAMLSAQTYDLVWLVSFFTCIALWNSILSTELLLLSSFGIPLATACQCWLYTDQLSLLTILIHAFTANALFQCLYWVFATHVRGMRCRPWRLQLLGGSVVLIHSVWFCTKQYWPPFYYVYGADQAQALGVLSLMTCMQLSCIFVVASQTPMCRRNDSQQHHVRAASLMRTTILCVWLFVVFPLLVTGDVALIVIKCEIEPTFLLRVLAPIAAWLVLVDNVDSDNTQETPLLLMLQAARILVVVRNGCLMFRTQQGKRMGNSNAILQALIVEMFLNLMEAFHGRLQIVLYGKVAKARTKGA